MARLTARNGVVVTVADDSVENLLRSGFTRAEEKTTPKKATAKATKATKKK